MKLNIEYKLLNGNILTKVIVFNHGDIYGAYDRWEGTSLLGRKFIFLGNYNKEDLDNMHIPYLNVKIVKSNDVSPNIHSWEKYSLRNTYRKEKIYNLLNS